MADREDDGENELIAAYCALYAFTPSGNLIDRADGNDIYAPHVVVDLEGDGTAGELGPDLRSRHGRLHHSRFRLRLPIVDHSQGRAFAHGSAQWI